MLATSAPSAWSPRAICGTSTIAPRIPVGRTSGTCASLVRTVTLHGQRQPVVVLTEQGRDLLERRRTPDEDRGQARQAFYAGVQKPRELEHDAQCYRAYLEAAEPLQQGGCRPTRVVLDYEMKREYQSFLQARNRGRRDSDGEPERDAL